MTKLKSREVWKCSPHIRRGNRSKGQLILTGGPAGGGLVTNLCPILVTPWTVARQAPLSLGFPRQEYQSGLTFLLQGIFPTWESNPGLLHCRQILYWLTHQGSLRNKNLGSVFIPIPKKGSAKECSNYHTIALISHASKVMLKILQKVGFNSTWTKNFQMFKLDLEKAEELEIKLPHLSDHRKSKSSRKTSISAFWLHQSLWLCGWQQTGKFWKRWEYQTIWPASWGTCMQVRKQQLEPELEQQTGSKIGKGVCQGCIFATCLFNLYAEHIMQNAG